MGAAAVRADVLVDNLTQPTEGYYGPIGSDANTNDFLVAQEFTVPSGLTPYRLDKVTLSLSPTSGGGNITVSIWNVGPDINPTNEIAVVATRLVANAGNADFIPATNITLLPGLYYVVAAPKTAADSGLVSWAYTASTNWTGSGALDGYADTRGGSWTSYAFGTPQQMSVQATPVATVGIHSRNGATVLSWPALLNTFALVSATNPATPAWLSVTNPPALVAGNYTLTNFWPDRARFFRLRQRFAVDNLEQPTAGYYGPIGNDSTSNDFLVAQEFALPTGNYTLDRVTLMLEPTSGSGSVTVSIWHAGADNNPTNKIAVVASQMVNNTGYVDFVPTAPIPLPSGGYYVVAAPTTVADNGLVNWAYTLSTPWIGFGSLGGYADTSAGSWVNYPLSNGPQQMRVQATPAAP
ncbi:MAG: hypothetical protein KGJ60_00665 [Verrucomicrobiota bacterium]|nr:hypothetical protein [Verrucomicrobiota bacterium]